MSSTAAERRQVFLACKGKAIFSGPYASYRNTGAIIKRIVKHKTSLRALFPKFSVGRVCRISKELLEAGVFESDIKAQLIFPDLLAPSTTKEREHNAFEDEAAHTQAKTVKEADLVCEEGESEIKQSPSISLSMKVETSVEEETHANQENTSVPLPPPSAEPELPIPSLHPSYFPYHAQHSILSQVQQVLEEGCFDFTKKWLPSELEDNGWDCAAAVELTKWTKLFKKWSSQLPDGSLQCSGPEFHARLAEVAGIRHTAVHRAPITARAVDAFIVSAVRLTEALRDSQRTSQLVNLHLDIQAKVNAMEFSKNALEGDLRREWEAIQRQGEELERKKVELRTKIIANDNEIKVLMGLLVKKSIERIFRGGTHENSSTGFVTADEKVEGD
ncbi:hypothetical protein AO1008_04516 [Aspergillus oryzae 100-8]|uniref:Ubiquinol-cytochrome-c reductase cytochrome c1 n=1 Tax=Aspergillus oryzae (strain 3.042) TaxID=1160506 RepID=I7ZND7_ASPO3|nr:hypothetical protein Ao3042_10637 [Aspergillus oryzae 3.042]KDE78194.1 hypothetical protein AO1008_04516 [Aspergillus oryzae 100-8]|eukprot:EIT73342.1 hypothetical protein Ao3042_10637 [Aspergillus oryzae 3.042]